MAVLVILSQLGLGLAAMRCLHLKALRDRRTPNSHQLGALNVGFLFAFGVMVIAIVADIADGDRRLLVVRQLWEAGIILLASVVALSMRVMLGEPRQKHKGGDDA